MTEEEMRREVKLDRLSLGICWAMLVMVMIVLAALVELAVSAIA